MALPIAGILLSVIVTAAVRILLGIGIGVVSFTVALPALYSFITSYFSGIPTEIMQVLGMLQIDSSITLILSAVAARMAYKVAAAPLVSFGGGS